MAETNSFTTVDLNLAGSSAETRSKPISVQRTVNLYPEVHQNEQGINETTLQAWPGLTDFYSSGLSNSKTSRYSEITEAIAGSFTLAATGDILGFSVDKATGNAISLDPRSQVNVFSGLTGTLSSSFTYPGGNARSVSTDSSGNLISVDVSVTPAQVNKHSGVSATIAASFTAPGAGVIAACLDDDGNAYVYNSSTQIISKMSGFTSTVSANYTITGALTAYGLDIDSNGVLVLSTVNGGLYSIDSSTGDIIDTYDHGLNGVVGGGLYNNFIYYHRGTGNLVSYSGYSSSLVTTTFQYKYGRGAYVFKGDYYAVIQSTLYKISSAGAATSIGTIPANGICTFADNGSTMVIAYGGIPMYYDGTTLGTLDVTFTAKTVDYINNQFVFGAGDGAFYSADAGAITVSGLNFATPESSPDELTGVKVFNQILYLISENSIEPWANTGTGNPPFERMSEAIVEDVGCLSPYGVTSTDSAMYLIGNDFMPYKIQSFQALPIGTPSICKEFQGYKLSDVTAWTCTFDGQKFVVFAFPTDLKCWVYSETTGQWFELDNGNEADRYLANTYHYIYNKRLVQDYNTGSIYELDFDAFTNSGDTIVRRRRLAVIAGDTFGKPGMSLEMSKMRFSMETGVGLDSGQGSDPEIMITPSYDGGRTFGQQVFVKTGEGGEFNTKVEWHKMKVFDRLVVELSYSDPTPFALYGASIDIREAGY